MLGLDEGYEGLPGLSISDFVDRFDDACAAQERVVHVNAGADGPDTERDARRKSMMSALDGAALGVTFGGPLVDPTSFWTWPTASSTGPASAPCSHCSRWAQTMSGSFGCLLSRGSRS